MKFIAMKLVVVLWFCLMLSFSSINPRRTLEDSRCKTPYRENGICTPIMQCPPMIEYFKYLRAPSQKTVQTLIDYLCDYVSNGIMVCCPHGSKIIYNDLRDPHDHSITQHKNTNLLPKKCGVLLGGNQIVTGSKTEIFEFPWMVLLGYRTQYGLEFQCGGSIINNRYILTAAHCVTNSRLTLVRCGEHNINSVRDCKYDYYFETQRCAPPIQDVAIEQVIIHPDYKSVISDDIALIRLARPLSFDIESIKPICLPLDSSTENHNLTSQILTVTGWGVTEAGPKSDDLLKADLRVTSHNYCQRIYARTGIRLNNRQLCALGENGEDACREDSGGPLQKIDTFDDGDRFVQYGIVSFGPIDCGQKDFPGVYTRTNSYMNWILDNLKP